MGAIQQLETLYQVYRWIYTAAFHFFRTEYGLVLDGEAVRFAAPDRVPFELRTAAAAVGEYIADEPVSSHGRVELMWYFHEQSLTHVYHRYGNLGARSDETRAPVA